jgi:hypothetical protein
LKLNGIAFFVCALSGADARAKMLTKFDSKSASLLSRSAVAWHALLMRLRPAAALARCFPARSQRPARANT